MSISYDKEIFSNENLILKVNFSGFKDSVVKADELSMSIYAYDNYGKPKFSQTLNFDQIKTLYEHLSQISIIRSSASVVSGKFIESTGEISVILNSLNSVDFSLLKNVLKKLKDENKIEKLLSSLSELEDETGEDIVNGISALQRRQVWQKEIDNLNLLLLLENESDLVAEIQHKDNFKQYVAGQPEKIFQNWIEKNIKWVFGVEYIKKHDFKTAGLSSQGDILMESMDGFLDFIELKRPKFEIFKFDSSHNCYYPSPELSKVIGQCFYYLQEMEDIKLKLEKEHKVKILHPRVKIICGRTTGFDEKQYNALRMLNSNLNYIEIITYDYVISCGYKMIENYS